MCTLMTHIIHLLTLISIRTWYEEFTHVAFITSYWKAYGRFTWWVKVNLGALTCVNPCMWLVQSTKSSLRPLHDGVKAIPSNSYTNEVKINSNALKTKSNIAQGKKLGQTTMISQFASLGHSRLSSLLGPSQLASHFEGLNPSCKAALNIIKV